MDTVWKVKVEVEAPGFERVYKSVRRLATAHKIEQIDCQEIAIVAILENPGNIPAAIRAARQALNSERRQRRVGRQIDNRVDGAEEEAVRLDRRTLPGGKTLTHLDEEGEYEDYGDQDQDHGDRDLDTQNEGYEGYELPKIPPHDLVGAIMFLARHGKDVGQIAERTGVTRARIRQILRGPEKIRQAVRMAEQQKELPGLECEPDDLRPPREPIKHKPRVAHAESATDQGLSLFSAVEGELA